MTEGERAGGTVLGLIQAGGHGSRMDVLTRERAKPVLPFAGGVRLVDFSLSAIAHAGITDGWISVQYQSQMLYRHLGHRLRAALAPNRRARPREARTMTVRASRAQVSRGSGEPGASRHRRSRRAPR